MQEILIIIDDMGGIIVETDEDEQQFASADEAIRYVQSLMPMSEAETLAPDAGADPAVMDEQAMWDEEAAARAPIH